MTARPIVTQFLGHGCMNDLTTERSFDSQATCVIDAICLFFDMLSMGVCTTRHWQTSGRLVQELNVCTVYISLPINQWKTLLKRSLTLILQMQNDAKQLKNDWNPGTLVII